MKGLNELDKSRGLERGQVSLEFVLLVGFAVIVAIVAFPFIA